MLLSKKLTYKAISNVKKWPVGPISSKKPYLLRNSLLTSFSLYPFSQWTCGDKFEIKLWILSTWLSLGDFQVESLSATFILWVFFSFKIKSLKIQDNGYQLILLLICFPTFYFFQWVAVPLIIIIYLILNVIRNSFS